MLLVVAWDGADFDVLDPLLHGGELPVLASLLQAGAHCDLHSTVPEVTFPAWTSFFTAASPARHGVTDFTVRDGYKVRFVNASYRRLPTFLARMSDAGMRVGAYAFPATYPAEPINGIQVCGFDSPFGTAGGHGFCHPGSLARRLESRYGGLAVDGPSQSLIDEGWHTRALGEMLETIDLRTRIVSDLMTAERFDCFAVHYGESDTVSHHFAQFCDAGSPRFRPGGPAAAIAQVYRRLDDALGRLLDAADTDATVMLVSDHGSGGAGDRVLFWNRWLADQGFLAFRNANGPVGLFGSAIASMAKQAALRLLPQSQQASLFARMRSLAGALESASRFSGIDWERTEIFSEELNYYPSLWLNIQGREPRGVVPPLRAETLLDTVTERLLAWRDPFDGKPVVEGVSRRAELFEGPFAAASPDLVVHLRRPDGYTYCSMSSAGGFERRPLRRMTSAEMSGVRGTTMSGSHRRDGICVIRGAGVRPGARDAGGIADAGATLLALAGLAVDPRADGRVWKDIVLPVTAAPSDAVTAEQTSAVTDSQVAYDVDQQREVEERLRALGYVE